MSEKVKSDRAMIHLTWTRSWVTRAFRVVCEFDTNTSDLDRVHWGLPKITVYHKPEYGVEPQDWVKALQFGGGSSALYPGDMDELEAVMRVMREEFHKTRPDISHVGVCASCRRPIETHGEECEVQP